MKLTVSYYFPPAQEPAVQVLTVTKKLADGNGKNRRAEVNADGTVNIARCENACRSRTEKPAGRFWKMDRPHDSSAWKFYRRPARRVAARSSGPACLLGGKRGPTDGQTAVEFCTKPKFLNPKPP